VKQFQFKSQRQFTDFGHNWAAEEVAAIVSEGEDAFKTNLVSQRAIERLLEIIGEACP